MASYKSIFSSLVLIFLFLQMISTFSKEKKIQNVRQCVRDMILSCRTLGYLPDTKQCIQMAFKFWVDDIPLPAVIKKFHKSFYEIIEKNNRLEDPERYCIRTNEGNQEAIMKCRLELKDFGNTIEDAVQIALYNKRLINYLRKIDAHQLNLFGLNYFSTKNMYKNIYENHSSTYYKRDLFGLDMGESSRSSGAESSRSSVNKFNGTAVAYLNFIATTFELTSDRKKISPLSFCVAEYFPPEGFEKFELDYLNNLFEE